MNIYTVVVGGKSKEDKTAKENSEMTNEARSTSGV